MKSRFRHKRVRVGLALAFLISQSALSDSKMIVQQINPDFDAAQLKDKKDENVVIRPAYYQSEPSDSELPLPIVIEHLLEQAGLTSAVNGWDPLSRDMLYLRAKNNPAEKLQALYSLLPPKGLRKFRKLVVESGEKR